MCVIIHFQAFLTQAARQAQVGGDIAWAELGVLSRPDDREARSETPSASHRTVTRSST